MIRLKSSDDVIFEVEEKAASLSQTIRNMIEEGMADEGKILPLLNVSSDTLSKVIEFCKMHAGVGDFVAGKGDSFAGEGGSEKSEADEKLKAWDAEFVKFDDHVPLFELINASNYLDIKDLQEITCQAAAEMIKDKSVEEVREIFGIENDYTEEEEAELRRENAWAFE